jgi:hypothetical protein
MKARRWAMAAALAAATAAGAAQQPSASGRYLVEYTPPSEGWPLNRQFSLPLHVRPSAASAPLGDDLKVEVEIDMPAHRHGADLVASVRDEGGGRFRIVGALMHMRGDWRIRLTLTSGTSVDEVVIPVHAD